MSSSAATLLVGGGGTETGVGTSAGGANGGAGGGGGAGHCTEVSGQGSWVLQMVLKSGFNPTFVLHGTSGEETADGVDESADMLCSDSSATEESVGASDTSFALGPRLLIVPLIAPWG